MVFLLNVAQAIIGKKNDKSCYGKIVVVDAKWFEIDLHLVQDRF